MPATQRLWNAPRTGLFVEPWSTEDSVWYAGGMARDQAMSVPAFRQGVSVIANTVGSFPLEGYHADQRTAELPPFLRQPDPDEPASVTWTRLASMLVLYPYAWLQVLRWDAAGFPRAGRVLDSAFVSLDGAGERVRYEGEELDPRALIRFDSPTAPGALVDGERILRTSLLIDEATRRFAAMRIPPGFIRQTDGPDWLPDEIRELLGDWDVARETGKTAFVPRGLDYATPIFDPTKLQLVEARAANAVDIARLLNLPPMSVNADQGGSLTYSTVESQGQQLVNQSLAAYLSAIAGRLSMDPYPFPDDGIPAATPVTPRGTYVRHDLTALLRGDLGARASAYAQMKSAGIMSVEEIRKREGLDPDTAPEEPAPAPPAAPAAPEGNDGQSATE